jgi:hypothetical protein
VLRRLTSLDGAATCGRRRLAPGNQGRFGEKGSVAGWYAPRTGESVASRGFVGRGLRAILALTKAPSQTIPPRSDCTAGAVLTRPRLPSP